MIAYIKGNIKYKTLSTLVVLHNDIGYEIRVTEPLLYSTQVGDTADLYVYHHIVEDYQSLFGFTHLQEREFFMLLISVSGIGPQSALKIMEVPSETIASAIINGDAESLQEIPGIGKKTAERMIVELKSKIQKQSTSYISFPQVSHTTPVGNNQALEALIQLGYSRLEAVRMLGNVSANIVHTQDIIKEALKYR